MTHFVLMVIITSAIVTLIIQLFGRKIVQAVMMTWLALCMAFGMMLPYVIAAMVLVGGIGYIIGRYG